MKEALAALHSGSVGKDAYVQLARNLSQLEEEASLLKTEVIKLKVCALKS